MPDDRFSLVIGLEALPFPGAVDVDPRLLAAIEAGGIESRCLQLLVRCRHPIQSRPKYDRDTKIRWLMEKQLDRQVKDLGPTKWGESKLNFIEFPIRTLRW